MKKNKGGIENKKTLGKKFIGIVVSDKMQKTAVVEIIRKKQHPLYKKIISRRKNFYADNDLGAVLKDKVVIQETRPLSKTKRFKVIKIIKKNK